MELHKKFYGYNGIHEIVDLTSTPKELAMPALPFSPRRLDFQSSDVIESTEKCTVENEIIILGNL